MKSFSLVTVLVLLVGFLLIPMAVFAETGQGTTENAPISQPLMREGTLAVKLVDALNLGTTSDEAQAESMLVTAGVAPRNGWIADYPVTPDIAGELRSAIGDAADARQLTIGKTEALQAFDDVLAANGLSMSPYGPEQAEGNAPSYTPDTTVINNYYYDEGPPVVTYYAPPPDYDYLYAWVPYPFWWWDFWFPGFFILTDFDIEIGGHHHHHHHGENGDFVTNHFVDPATGRMSRINPASRVNGGTFANTRGTGWTSPLARNSAQAIFNKSRSVAMAGRTGGVSNRPFRNSAFTPTSRTRGAISGAPGGRTFSSPSATRWTTRPSLNGGRTFNTYSSNRRAFTPGSGSRTFSAPRASGRSYYSRPSYSRPSYSSGRSFAPSYSGGRSFSAPSAGRSFSSPSVGRSFSGSSSVGRSFGSGGSFGGGRSFGGSFGGRR